MSIKSRLEKIEAELGANDDKDYLFVRYGYRLGQPVAVILERRGGKICRDIDPLSEEGKAILS